MKIHLRERKLKNGKSRLYLDIYKGYVKKNGKTNAIREYEYLDLYLYQKANDFIKTSYVAQLIDMLPKSIDLQ